MSQESPPLPNPAVYLNYLTPPVANDYEITRNITLITLGVRCAVMI